jgi:hypothetical protein
MMTAIVAQRWVWIAMLATLATVPEARCQEFAKRQSECLTLNCSSASRSYSFDEMPEPQESSSTTAIPPKTATKSNFVREGEWRKLPANFLHDQKDMWLFPLKVAEGHYWLPAALVTGATAALIGTDAKTEPYFRQTDTFQIRITRWAARYPAA